MAVRDRHLYEPPEGDKPPIWWMRYLLILTCTGVPFAHGTNDGQKSIGLIMLTIIGLMPSTYTLNMEINSQQIATVASASPAAKALIEHFGDDRKQRGIDSAQALGDRFAHIKAAADIPDSERSTVRNDLNRVLEQLKTVGEAKGISDTDKKHAKAIHDDLMKSVDYAPWWVRILSALCLGIGTIEIVCPWNACRTPAEPGCLVGRCFCGRRRVSSIGLPIIQNRHPNKFELTYIRGPAPHFAEPTDDWRRLKTIEEAHRIAKEAGADKDQTAVATQRPRPREIICPR
jgi:hypothetical protein